MTGVLRAGQVGALLVAVGLLRGCVGPGACAPDSYAPPLKGHYVVVDADEPAFIGATADVTSFSDTQGLLTVSYESEDGAHSVSYVLGYPLCR